MHAAWLNSRRQLSAVLPASFRALLVSCVFVSVWQAPVPWLHRHGGDGHHGDPSRLAIHLSTWHAHKPESGEWHLHFAMLGDILRGEGDPIPADDGHNQAQDLFSQVTIAIEPVQSAAVGWIVTPPELAAIAYPPSAFGSPPKSHTDAPRQFFSDFTVSRSLESLLCTAQC